MHWVGLLFKPSQAHQHRLKCIGYTHHTPHTSFVPYVTSNEARAITLGLLSLRNRVTKAMTLRYDQGTLELSERKLSLSGLPTWHTITKTANAHQTQLNVDQIIAGSLALKRKAERAADAAKHETAKTFAIKCPRCRAERDAVRAKLMKTIAWRSLHCAACGKASSSRRWACPCGCSWHQCATHMHILRNVEPYRVVARKAEHSVRVFSAPRVARYSRKFKCAAKLGTQMHEKPTIRLGPVLTARFPHLAA